MHGAGCRDGGSVRGVLRSCAHLQEQEAHNQSSDDGENNGDDRCLMRSLKAARGAFSHQCTMITRSKPLDGDSGARRRATPEQNAEINHTCSMVAAPSR